jgi:cell division protein FtsW (lipid II flippase)
LVEFGAYSEIHRLGLYICGVTRDKGMIKWCWLLFLVAHWIIIAEDIKNSGLILDCFPLTIVAAILKYHLVLGFIVYLGLIVYFVLDMPVKHYMKRYKDKKNKTEKSFSNIAASQFCFSRSNKSTTTLQF